MNGAFSSEYYVRKYIGLSGEFRYSISRDFVKVGLFHDLVAFGKLDEMRVKESFGIANSFGIALHVLVLDAFQTDTYFGLGFSSEGRFDAGLSVSVRMAY